MRWGQRGHMRRAVTFVSGRLPGTTTFAAGRPEVDWRPKREHLTRADERAQCHRHVDERNVAMSTALLQYPKGDRACGDRRKENCPC